MCFDLEFGYIIKIFFLKYWLCDGYVSFKNVYMRYYLGGLVVFKNLIFEIQFRNKLGIVGWMGDGKLFIILVFLCMFEVEGEIFIDGVCIIGV